MPKTSLAVKGTELYSSSSLPAPSDVTFFFSLRYPRAWLNRRLNERCWNRILESGLPLVFLWSNIKFEIRISKSETISKFKYLKFKRILLKFGIYGLNIGICFVFRISCLGFCFNYVLPHKRPQHFRHHYAAVFLLVIFQDGD